MPTRQNSKFTSNAQISRNIKQGNNKSIYVAIAIVIVLTIVAMTGVYYEYW